MGILATLIRWLGRIIPPAADKPSAAKELTAKETLLAQSSARAKAEHERKRENRKRTSSPQWQEARRKVLQRANYTCEKCRTTRATAVRYRGRTPYGFSGEAINP